MLGKLNGALAIAIHDIGGNEVFLARDRFGKKPLFYSSGSGFFVWASEMKSILKVCNQSREISNDAINLFFSYSHIPAPFTIYKDIYKLKPGHFILLDTDTLSFRVEAWWKNSKGPGTELRHNKSLLNYSEAQAALRHLMYDAVRIRMISDVPIGSFLSGGIDSAIITAIMADLSDTQIKAYTVGFKKRRFDESERARIVASHCKLDHTIYYLEEDHLNAEVDKVILNFDEPFGDSSSLASYAISKITGRDVKVVLTGDGGDEVFGGYNRYLMPYYAGLYRSIIPGIVHKTSSPRFSEHH